MIGKDGEAQEIIPEAVYQKNCLSNSLNALVQMVRTEGVSVDRCADKLYLSVKDHMTVACFWPSAEGLAGGAYFLLRGAGKGRSRLGRRGEDGL